MKKRYIVLAAVAGIVAGGVYWVNQNLEGLVKSAVNKYGSQITGTEVKLQGFDISPLQGSVRLKGLSVANPKGYSQPEIINLGEVFVKVDMKSLTSPLIVVKEVLVSNPQVTYELKNVTSNNVSELLANINKNTSSDSSPAKSTSKTESSSSSKKVAVDLVKVEDGKINIAASIAGEGAAAGIALPSIEIKDIGREKNSSGKGIVETTAVILKKILNASYQTVVNQGLGNLKNVATDGIKALKDNAESTKENAKGLFKSFF
ncbi:MAG: hypothetical protein IJ689_07405 [Alphaproteobacteria bacterium]|nr:hypothetical protein [Alphaproteobacteria bacterium]